MKYVFLLNIFGKKDICDIYQRIEAYAKANNLDYVIEVNSCEQSTEDILIKYKNGNNMIIAVGGDGMLNKVLNNVVNTRNLLSYIPYGTGNDFNRTVKETLKNGYNTIDLVKINEKYFINVACFGIDADIANDDTFIHNTKIPESQRYNAGVLYHFVKYKPRHMIVKTEHEVMDANFTTVVVANGKYYGGGYKIGASSLLNDGKFNVYLAEDLNKIAMAKLILSTKNGSHENSKHIEMITTDKVTIKCDEQVSCNIDGEPYTSDIFNIELIPKGIDIYNDKQLIKSILNDK